jgi:RNA polymerase-binding transcription factor DksA
LFQKKPELMASKKKPAPKKAAKPAKKAVAKKPAAKKPAKKVVTKKPAPKKVAKPVAKKPAKPVAKVVAKPAAKPVIKQAVKPAPAAPVVAAKPAAPPPPLPKKPNPNDPKSLVTIKPPVKQVLKKEPIKPSKVVMPKITTKSSVKYEPEFTKSVLDAQVAEHSGPTQRYSDPELNEFREIIQKKLDAAKKELTYLQGLITRKDESGGDMDEGRYMTMEDGSVSMEREQLSQMASRQITFIDHLEKAMMRIENKTYGICRVTGKLIDKARLRAVPHATLSIEAKQMMSK